MSDREIYILGVGNNTEVYIDLVEACGYKPVGLYHYNEDRIGERLHDIPILDSNSNLFKNSLEGKLFAISVGDNKIRTYLANMIRSLNGKLPKLIHPTAIVSKYAKVSESVVIHANSVIQAGADIAEDTVVSYNASVTHTSKIGKSCYLAAYAHVGAYVCVYNNVLIGQGAIIVSSKVDYIGENAIIGAGAVVTKNVENNQVVVGNPAKVIRLI